MKDDVADIDQSGLGGRPRKSPGAFRTISEVAEDLHIPQHVLRFWETKFPQIRPLKRGGGRRYYRPEDITLLRRISDLLYVQGYTIKGVQRLLHEHGGRLADNIPPAAAGDRDDDDQHFLFGAPASGAPPPPAEHIRMDLRTALDAILTELEEIRTMLVSTG